MFHFFFLLLISSFLPVSKQECNLGQRRKVQGEKLKQELNSSDHNWHSPLHQVALSLTSVQSGSNFMGQAKIKKRKKNFY